MGFATPLASVQATRANLAEATVAKPPLVNPRSLANVSAKGSRAVCARHAGIRGWPAQTRHAAWLSRTKDGQCQADGPLRSTEG